MKKKLILSLVLQVIALNGFTQDTIQNKTIAPVLKEYWNSIYSFNKVAVQRIEESFEVYVNIHKDAFKYITKDSAMSNEEALQNRLTGEWSYTISTPFQEQQVGKLIIYQKDDELFFKMDDDNYSGEIPMRHVTNSAKYVAYETIEELDITAKYSFLLIGDDYLKITVNMGNIFYLINARKENKENVESDE